jgi:hypothetical protein
LTPLHCAATTTPGQCDFNGNGLSTDSVIHVFNVRAETVQSFPIVESKPPDVPPFPETSDDQTLLTLQLPESSIGTDVNEDGFVTDDLVVLILGDADEDGSLDGSAPGPGAADNCAEAGNPTQVDTDGDALGDVVCDPNPFSFGPQGLVCDVDRNGQVDSADVGLIFAARGTPAAPGNDVRDANADGAIDVLDSGFCADHCTYANCATSPPSGGCGLGGELLLALLAWRAARHGWART